MRLAVKGCASCLIVRLLFPNSLMRWPPVIPVYRARVPSPPGATMRFVSAARSGCVAALGGRPASRLMLSATSELKPSVPGPAPISPKPCRRTTGSRTSSPARVAQVVLERRLRPGHVMDAVECGDQLVPLSQITSLESRHRASASSSRPETGSSPAHRVE